MRIAMIGLGDIAQKAYLPVVANDPEITPVLCTRNTETLTSLSKKYRVGETCTDIDEAIRGGIDGAMVHSNTESHPQMVTALLNAGIPVFVDKPLSYRLADSEHMLNLAAQRKLPLFVGFNRRYAPLIKAIDEPNPVHIRLQKNRANQPGEPRVFVYDDFIHVLDTLRFLTGGDIENLHTTPYCQDDRLASIHVQWQSGKTLLTGSMNRISGVVEEKLELFGQRQKWEICGLSQGSYHAFDARRGSLKTELGFDDWQPTLYKRGFVSMVDAFIDQVNSGHAPTAQYDDILATHRLCEQVLRSTQ